MASSLTYESSFLRRRSWRKYALAAFAVLISIASYFGLVRGVFVRGVRGDAVSAPAAGTLIVSQNGDGQYSSINAAIAAAAAGTTILVRAGSYYEAVTIDKDVTLIGDQGAAIECAKDGCLRITAARATIRNLNISANVGFLTRLIKFRQRTAAVIISSGRSLIEDCEVTSNNGVGILVTGSNSAPEIRNVRVHDCFLNGISFTKRSSGLVENSRGYNNRWAAIRADKGSSPIIRRSKIHGGKMDGILIDLGATATIEECEVFDNNFSGVHVRERSSVSLRQSKIFRNADSGVDIHHESYGEVESCDVFDNKDSGIKVSYESGSRILNTKVFKQGTVGVVVWRNSTTEIEGATIYENANGLWVESGGKPLVRKSVLRSNTYSGVVVENGGDPLIEQSQIYGGKGTGIYFYEGGKGLINDCEVFGNANSNIIIASGSNPQIRKTRLSESAYAGVLVMNGGAGSIIESEIFNNYLGIEVHAKSTFTVQDCTLKNNRHGSWKIADGAALTRERNSE